MYPFNFVLNVGDEELKFYRETTLEENLHLFSRAGYDWCLQPYLRLRKSCSALPVQLSNRLLPNCINIIHSAELNILVGDPDCFIVCAKADFPRRRWAHFHLVQNKNQIEKNTAFIPHWVQPGLIGRDSKRSLLERVGYAGQVFNGNLAAPEQEWKELFAGHGLEFVVLPPEACFDLHEIDVLIGIRGFNQLPYNTKPASKLVNAWHARIPFIGGFDSAFEQLGTPGKDYVRVKSMQEVLSTVVELQCNKGMYDSLVENGGKMAKQYNDAETLKRWEEVLLGPVADRYQKWKTNSEAEKRRFFYLTTLSRVETKGKEVVKKILRSDQIQKVKQLFGR